MSGDNVNNKKELEVKTSSEEVVNSNSIEFEDATDDEQNTTMENSMKVPPSL